MTGAAVKPSPTLLEATKPKGFPISSGGGGGSKRLQPIKATDLRNIDMVSSPLTAGTTNASKKAESAMRMTQPSSSDSAAHLINATDGSATDPSATPGGYASMTDFGVGKHKGPSSFLNRNGSKMLSGSGTGTGGASRRMPSLSKSGGGTSGKQALPSIDHSKVMEKLRSITGKSEDFGATASSDSNVQFSKPKIGVKARIVSSSTQGLSRVAGSNRDLRQVEKEGAKSTMTQKKESLTKQRKRVASQGMRTEHKVITTDDGTNQPAVRIRNSNYLAPNLQGSARSKK